MKKLIFIIIAIAATVCVNAQEQSLAYNTNIVIGDYVNPSSDNSYIPITLTQYREYMALVAKPLEGCPNYILSENQDWEQNIKWFDQDSLNNESKINLSIYVEVENSPLGLFQTKCDSVFTISTLDWKEAQAYGRKYADVLLQEKIKQWRKK